MTLTSDERREVADSLRARAVRLDFAYPSMHAQNSFWMEHTLREIVEAIGCAENPHPAQWLVRLADLIDPTCKNLTTRPADVLFCSECGEHVDIASVENADDYHARYCPYCGARVVDE
jgi:DNA-directed RNA polymerase subunit RPC12/RpoP